MGGRGSAGREVSRENIIDVSGQLRLSSNAHPLAAAVLLAFPSFRPPASPHPHAVWRTPPAIPRRTVAVLGKEAGPQPAGAVGAVALRPLRLRRLPAAVAAERALATLRVAAAGGAAPSQTVLPRVEVVASPLPGAAASPLLPAPSSSQGQRRSSAAPALAAVATATQAARCRASARAQRLLSAAEWSLEASCLGTAQRRWRTIETRRGACGR